MKDKEELSILENEVLGLCTEDYIGAWEIFWFIKDHSATSIKNHFRLYLGTIEKLLSKDFIEAFGKNRKKKLNKLVLNFIKKRKNDIINASNLNYLPWFGATSRGEQYYLNYKQKQPDVGL